VKLARRNFLRGVGGAFLGLPWLEALDGRVAHAQSSAIPPFAIFFRQADGVASAQNTGEIGAEPERFWPRNEGALDTANLEGRALGELAGYSNRLLVVGNANMENFPYGDGHARGALQLLTARGPVIPYRGGYSEANGESLDHRIGRELNGNGNDSLFLHTGSTGGWLGGPCISYRGPGNRRSALVDPASAYRVLTGGQPGVPQEVLLRQGRRQHSINDRVRLELQALLARPELSLADRERLDLHLSSVRDLEISLSCRLDTSLEQKLAGAVRNTLDGDIVLANARLHMDIAALAVACGHTRAVTIQVGNGNDGETRYRDPKSGALMEGNFHYVSHRRLSHDGSGTIIPGSDLLHHEIDLQFARTFRYLLERLDQYQFPQGSLLDAGMAIWMNDLGNGPAHSSQNCPCIIAGGAGGLLKQGQFIRVSGGKLGVSNHGRLLNTLGSAAGLRTTSGELIADFGDPSLNREPLTELLK
jgi:hypothetical protein